MTEIKNEQVTKVSFVDKNKERFKIEIVLEDKEKGKTLNIRSEGGQHRHAPANEPQQRLLDLWEEYHLNDMQAGTPRQREAVKGTSSYEDSRNKLTHVNRETGGESFYDYGVLTQKIDFWNKELAILNKWHENDPMAKEQRKTETELDLPHYYEEKLEEYTEQRNDAQKRLRTTLLFDTLPDGTLYQYGTAWLMKDLPEDIEEQIEEIVQEIEEAEEERKGDSLEDIDDDELVTLIEEKTDFRGRDSELAAAFVRIFNLSENDFDSIEIDGNRCEVEGVSYLAGTDSEMDQEWDQNLESYIDECLEIPDSVKNYFDREAWKSDARMDGRGHSLNTYDGGERYAEINDTPYYAYRN